MKKIAITGSTGLVGSRIVALLQNEFEFIHVLQDQIDITDRSSVQNFIRNTEFDLFLHLAAYTNVDGAETDRDLAHKVNVTGTKHVFDEVTAKGREFVYISTDFVFSGDNPPYDENTTPHPKGYYGQTKYEGEQIVKDKAMIARISYPYRAQFEGKKDLVHTIKGMLEEGRELTMITDSTITTTFIDDIAYALGHLMGNFSPEIFHIVGSDSMSPYDAGRTIAKVFGLDMSLIKPTTYETYFKDRAKRPRYSEMKSKKNTFHPMKSLQEGLLEVKRQGV